MPDLRTLLADGHVHVSDGAMGTMLYSKGLFLNVCYDELNLRQPDVIRDVHREYVRAGAELIETNTFGANPVKLAHHGLAADTELINEAAARLAREAAGDRAARRGRHRAARHPHRALRRDLGGGGAGAFARQAAGLLAGGVDGFLLETFSDVEELRAAVHAIRAPVRPADHRADDRRRGRPHLLRHRARRLRPRDRRHGRGRHRGELLRRTPRRAGGHRATGQGGDPPAQRHAQRRAAPRCRRPQDVHGLARVHGGLRAAHGGSRCAHRRRLLRHHARPYQGDGGLRAQRLAASRDSHLGLADGGAGRAGSAARPSAPDSAPSWPPGTFVTTVEIVPPKGVDPAPMYAQVRAPQGRGGGCRQRAGRTTGPEPDGRPHFGAAHRARGRARGGGPLRLPGPQSPRHAVRSARRRPPPASATCSSSPATRRRWAPTPTPPPSSTSTRSG